MLAILPWQIDAHGQLDRSLHVVDGTSVKVQQSAAGPKSERGGEALGDSHGAYSKRDHTTLSKSATRAQVANRVAVAGIRLALISPLGEAVVAAADQAAPRAVFALCC
jgi:hypothetical protein